jgi:hypothetical protein
MAMNAAGLNFVPDQVIAERDVLLAPHA